MLITTFSRSCCLPLGLYLSSLSERCCGKEQTASERHWQMKRGCCSPAAHGELFNLFPARWAHLHPYGPVAVQPKHQWCPAPCSHQARVTKWPRGGTAAEQEAGRAGWWQLTSSQATASVGWQPAKPSLNASAHNRVAGVP